jgi:hypothetical protein
MRIALRIPIRSDSHAHGSTDSPSPRVAAETTSEARDGSTSASRAISVNSPCGAYSTENAANPAHHNAALRRRFARIRPLHPAAYIL